MSIPRWAGAPFTIGTTRCRILWFRVVGAAGLLGALLLAGGSQAERARDATAHARAAATSRPASRPASRPTSRPTEGELLLEFYDVADLVQSPPLVPEGYRGPRPSQPDWLIRLVERRLGPSGRSGTIEMELDVLIVRQPLRNHRKVVMLLDALRRTPRAPQPQPGD